MNAAGPTKVCIACKQEKPCGPGQAFYRNGKGRPTRSDCRDCCRAYRRGLSHRETGRSSRARRRLAAYGLEQLAVDICAQYGVQLRLVIGDAKDRTRIVPVRHALWAAIYARPGWSLPTLAELFEVDWTTVRNGITRHVWRVKEARRVA